METLMILSQHRNHYYSRNHFGSSPSRGFREINCRAFQSEGCINQTPFAVQSPPTKKRASSFSQASEGKNHRKSSPITITPKSSTKEEIFTVGLSYSELWAGPAYSNSPPPSALPIPKFSLRQTRSVSLEIPPMHTDIAVHPIARSAPSSPTRESHLANDFILTAASATENLRRILHLDFCPD